MRSNGRETRKSACASSTGSISATQCRNPWGRDDCGAIGPWGIPLFEIRDPRPQLLILKESEQSLQDLHQGKQIIAGNHRATVAQEHRQPERSPAAATPSQPPPMLLYRELDSAMQVVSFSEARESFKAVLDRVEADADVTLITRRHAQGAVVMSLDTYNSLMETVHLLRSPANAAHLQRSLEQAERGELLAHPLLDTDQLDADPLDAGS